MNGNDTTRHEDQNGPDRNQETFAHSAKVSGDAMTAKVKDLLHQGNVRRITVKNKQGHTVIEIPVTAGVVAAIAAPALTAVAAIAALASDWEIEVHHETKPDPANSCDNHRSQMGSWD
ncbi:DUF4342 domain-containing protein [Dermatophilaceae bacterium Sec6.4]